MVGPMPRSIRLATRALILRDDKLLIVNAWKGRDHLWTVPGGGAEPHASLPANLAREVLEETGLTVKVGAPCLINEFNDTKYDFHQVDLYFRCTIVSGEVSEAWRDPEGVVSFRRWVTREELRGLTHRPKSLADVAWGDTQDLTYDALEPILR